MLDRRALIIACVLVLLALGAVVIWQTRPRTQITGRSLTAPVQPAKVETRNLHVEGCKEDFIVKPGQLVEPRVAPGVAPDQFRSLYGKESRRENRQILVWDQYPYSLADGYFGPQKPSNFVQIHVNQGHALETLDGIELGIDSFVTIYRKMSDRKIDVQERIEQGDGSWTLIVSFYSSCGKQFRSEYSRTIPASPEVDALIAPKPLLDSNGHPLPGVGPRRTGVFMNKAVSDFALVPSDGSDAPANGSLPIVLRGSD